MCGGVFGPVHQGDGFGVGAVASLRARLAAKQRDSTPPGRLDNLVKRSNGGGLAGHPLVVGRPCRCAKVIGWATAERLAHPDVGDPSRLQRGAKRVLIELRRPAGEGLRPDVDDSRDVMARQVVEERLKGQKAMPGGVDRCHLESVSDQAV